MAGGKRACASTVARPDARCVLDCGAECALAAGARGCGIVTRAADSYSAILESFAALNNELAELHGEIVREAQAPFASEMIPVEYDHQR